MHGASRISYLRKAIEIPRVSRKVSRAVIKGSRRSHSLFQTSLTTGDLAMTLSDATDAGLLQSEHPLEKPKSLGNLPNYAVAAILIGGLFYVAWSLTQDLTSAVAVPWILLGLALVTALGFEFVNGFHDTANAVATVIYTNSMPAEIAVI
jgi:hypothetical protein